MVRGGECGEVSELSRRVDGIAEFRIDSLSSLEVEISSIRKFTRSPYGKREEESTQK